MYEERAAKLAELEYQRRIQTEKDNNTQMLNTWKSTVNGHWAARTGEFSHGRQQRGWQVATSGAALLKQNNKW